MAANAFCHADEPADGHQGMGARKVLWVAGFDGEQNSQDVCGWSDAPSHPTGADPLYTVANNLSEALTHLDADRFDVVLLHVPVQDVVTETSLEQLFQDGRHTPVIVYAPHANLADAVRWTKLGAQQVVQRLSEALSAIRETLGRPEGRSNTSCLSSRPAWRDMLIGESRRMHNTAEVIRLVASRRCTVLITGETGTGKEVVARAIHAASNRAPFDLVAVNCSALPEHLLEAELFGHVKGAFTGAANHRMGRFEQAHRGTMFLDEIGDLCLPLQAKLLRVLQERELQRLGSSDTVKLDVRVIAATNANLEQKVRRGEFREDLYYRLNVVPIVLPPVRERIHDIPLLVQHFLKRVCREEGIPCKYASREVLEWLCGHDWPGNVRQIENAIEMAVALSGERNLLYPSDFPLPSRTRENITRHHFVAVPDHGLDFEKTVGSIELNILEQALRKTGGNKKQAAEMLRLKRTTLAAKLKILSGGTQLLAASAQ